MSAAPLSASANPAELQAVGSAAPRLWHRALRTPSFVAGFTVTGSILLLVLLVPVFAPNPLHQNLFDTFAGPSAAHLFGTDDLGRDVFSRLLYAGRTDIEVGVLAVMARSSAPSPATTAAGSTRS
jgi:peptide/nickel transport system permease protein